MSGPNRMPASVIEMLPDAEAIRNARLPRLIRLAVWLPLVVVVTALVWASLAKTEIILSCPARVVSDRQGARLEAEIRSDAIALVQAGSEARIKLAAYPFQRYGMLSGVVTNLATDVSERYVGGTVVRSYRAQLALSGTLRQVSGDFRLRNGLDAVCEFRCGRRRVIEYVLYPLVKAFDEVAREP